MGEIACCNDSINPQSNKFAMGVGNIGLQVTQNLITTLYDVPADCDLGLLCIPAVHSYTVIPAVQHLLILYRMRVWMLLFFTVSFDLWHRSLFPRGGGGGRGDSHMEQTGMLVGNFEFSP